MYVSGDKLAHSDFANPSTVLVGSLVSNPIMRSRLPHRKSRNHVYFLGKSHLLRCARTREHENTREREREHNADTKSVHRGVKSAAFPFMLITTTRRTRHTKEVWNTKGKTKPRSRFVRHVQCSHPPDPTFTHKHDPNMNPTHTIYVHCPSLCVEDLAWDVIQIFHVLKKRN